MYKVLGIQWICLNRGSSRLESTDLLGPKNLYYSTVHSVNAKEEPALSQETSVTPTDYSKLQYHKCDKDRSPERNMKEGKLQLCTLTCLVILAVAVIAAFVGVVVAFINSFSKS